ASAGIWGTIGMDRGVVVFSPNGLTLAVAGPGKGTSSKACLKTDDRPPVKELGIGCCELRKKRASRRTQHSVLKAQRSSPKMQPIILLGYGGNYADIVDTIEDLNQAEG